MIDDLTARGEASQMFSDGLASVDWSPFDISAAPLIKWEGRDTDPKPPSAILPYYRYTYEPLDGGQGSLAGDKSTRLWDRSGLIMIQSFGTSASGRGIEQAEYMATMALRAYEGKQSPNCMWFRNCRTLRVGPSGAWYQYNTIIEFEYNNVR